MLVFRKWKDRNCCAKDVRLCVRFNLSRQEREQLLLEQQRQLLLLAQRRRLEEQAETRGLFQEDAEVRLARMVRVARRQQPPQRQAFETHVLERQQQQQAELVDEDTEEDTDAVSLSMVEPNP